MNGTVDELTGASTIIDLVHERIHAGRTFQTSYKSPEGSEVADDGTVEVLVKNTTIPVHFTFSATGGGNLELSLFEAPTTTNDGSQLNVVGMNRQRSIAPTVTTFLSPTITADGDQLFNGFDSRGVGLTTPEGREGSEWVLRRNTDYLIRITNRAGGARDIAVILQWYQALGG